MSDYEIINHPQHYNIPGKKECIEQMLEDYGAEVTITFCLTSAFKYLYRMGNKPDNPADKDIKKAWWYYRYSVNLFAKDKLLERKENLLRLKNYVEMELMKLEIDKIAD